MAMHQPVEYADASPEVRAVYDEIMATRKTDWINNFWKALGGWPGFCFGISGWWVPRPSAL